MSTSAKSLLRNPLFWSLLLFILVFSHREPGSVNDMSRMAFAESLLVKGKPWTENSSYFNTLDMVFHEGHFYSDKPILLSLYSTAIIFPLHFFIHFDPHWGRSVLYYVVSVTSSGLSLMVILIYLHRLFGLMGLDRRLFPWTAAAVLLGTCLLSFGVVYSNHAVEAALIFSSFYYLVAYRLCGHARSPLITAILLGIAFLIHGLAGAVFLGLTALYFLLSRFRDFLKYACCAVLVLALGFSLNKVVNGEFKPFYLMPETYLYKGSYWLTYPIIPGLTREMIHDKFVELGLPAELMRESFVRHLAYQDQMANPLSFARKLFMRHDYLTFNALCVFAFFSALRCMWQKNFRFRRETLWALLGTVGLYAGLIFLRAEAGQSFGNRLMIPALPLVSFFTVFGLMHAPNPGFFKFAIWPVIAINLAGIVQPWHVPPEMFARVGHTVFWVCLALFVLTLFVKKLDRFLESIYRVLMRRTGFAVLGVGGLVFLAQFSYRGVTYGSVPWIQWVIFVFGLWAVFRAVPK